MKSNDVNFKQIEYLSTELLTNFAKSYSVSFPELKLEMFALVKFLKHKFQLLEKSNLHNIAALATDDGAIASGYGIIRNDYYQNQKNLSVGLVCDVFTSPDFRKMGLFKKVSLLAIAREELTETNFLIGFPIRDEVMPGHLSVGWTHIFDMPLWWGFPRLGSIRDVQKKPALHSCVFPTQSKSIAIKTSDEFLKWRFSLYNVEYLIVSVPNSDNFAIVRKAKIRNLPFTCIVFMHSTSKHNTKVIVRKIRNLSLRLGTLGVLGCWNNSYASDLFLATSGLRKSSKFQKVIVRELSGFNCPREEGQYRLSWMDSDTL